MSLSSSFRVFQDVQTDARRISTAVKNECVAEVTEPNALTKPLKVSPELSKFIGAKEESCGETMKKIWEYIKLNNL